MDGQTIDYQAVLADLKKRRDDMDRAIAALEMIVAGQTGSAPGSLVDEANIPSDAFFGMTIREAVKKYLGIVKRKKPLHEIVKALEAGGIPHQSKNFYMSVSTSVRRDKDIVKVGGEWGLAGWYGGNARKQKPGKSKAEPANEKNPREAENEPLKALPSPNGPVQLS